MLWSTPVPDHHTSRPSCVHRPPNLDKIRYLQVESRLPPCVCGTQRSAQTQPGGFGPLHGSGHDLHDRGTTLHDPLYMNDQIVSATIMRSVRGENLLSILHSFSFSF